MARNKTDPLAKRRNETWLQWRSRVAAANQNEREKAEPIVPVEAQRHGRYVADFVTDVDDGTKAHTLINQANRDELPAIVLRWAKKGHVGFEEPAMGAMVRCIHLWHRRPLIGSLTAQYGEHTASSGGGADGSICKALDETDELEGYRAMFHPAHWKVYENVLRHGYTLSDAGEAIDGTPVQNVASVRQIVGLVANVIAQKMRA